MKFTRPHIEKTNDRKAVRAMALGAVIQDLASKDWEVFPAIGRHRSCDLVAVNKDGEVILAECRAAIIDPKPGGDDVLSSYRKLDHSTVLAVVDHRDMHVFYGHPDAEDGQVSDDPLRVETQEVVLAEISPEGLLGGTA